MLYFKIVSMVDLGESETYRVAPKSDMVGYLADLRWIPNIWPISKLDTEYLANICAGYQIFGKAGYLMS